MLHDLTWLDVGQQFPPASERDRIQRYNDNIDVFNSEIPAAYKEYIRRIARVIGDFEDIVSFPVLFNYQKLMSLKMADLVCGEYPTITGTTDSETDELVTIMSDTDFNAKMFSTVLDISRFGDAVWRVYRDTSRRNTFTVWDPRQWFPIVSQDGTNTILQHVLCWVENRGDDLHPDYYLVAQIHNKGYYDQRVFKMDRLGGQLQCKVSSERVHTGLTENAVMHIRAYATTDTVYGCDDYQQIDSIVCEMMTRVAQISNILDQHSDPVLTGPATLLETDPITGRRSFKKGRYYATQPEDNEPKYLTWNGQLEAAFKQVALLVDQLHILSEMGSALTGAPSAGNSEVVSGTAMRFKMVSPLAKARRIANSLTKKTRELFASLSAAGYDHELSAQNISIVWADGLPDDPRETIEYVKLATGENKIVPLKDAIVNELGKTPKEAARWIDAIDERANALEANLDPVDPMQADPHTGPVKGQVASTKGSKKGVASFKSPKNE